MYNQQNFFFKFQNCPRLLKCGDIVAQGCSSIHDYLKCKNKEARAQASQVLASPVRFN